MSTDVGEDVIGGEMPKSESLGFLSRTCIDGGSGTTMFSGSSAAIKALLIVSVINVKTVSTLLRTSRAISICIKSLSPGYLDRTVIAYLIWLGCNNFQEI